MINRQVNLADNTIGEEEIDAVTAVLKSGWLSADRVTQEFEADFARAVGTSSAVFVSSGTAALHLAVLALGLRRGDEIIVPSLNFVASAAVSALHGVVPVFADVESEVDLTVGVRDIERLIGPRTKAIVAMHYGGFPAQIRRITDVAAAHGLAVIEDAAHAPLVRGPGGSLGTFGDIGCFSFFATKNITTAEGGMVLARDNAVLDRIRAMRAHHLTGTSRTRTGYDIAGIGLNYRPTEIAAAMGRVQLSKLDADRAVRRTVVQTYRDRLRDAVTVPFADVTDDSAHHLFATVLPEGVDRDQIRATLREHGVHTSVHYPPTHRLSYYLDDPDGLRVGAAPREQLPITNAIADRLLSLPLHSRMTPADADYVAHHVLTALRTG